MKEEFYIKGREPEQDFYRLLQACTLERLQESAGKVWTDFNAHDPGLTIADVLNYALSELDYRLRFRIPDYLTGPDRPFDPERYGLFAPVKVFPVDPVTVTDYRKLLLDRIGLLENVWVYPAREAEGCRYDVLAELSPLASEGCREEVRREIVRTFQAFRNIGEELHEVRFISRRPLTLTGDIEIRAGVQVLKVLTDIYWEAQLFFLGGIRYLRLEDLLAKGVTPDEILDGPELRHWVLDEEVLQPVADRYPVTVLFRRLAGLKGVETVRALGFTDGEREFREVIAVEDPADSFTVEIPDNKEKLRLTLWSGGSRVKVEVSALPFLLYARYARFFGRHNCSEDLSALASYPSGTYRPMYRHSSVMNDFPDCYGVNRWGVAAGETELRKAQAKQLRGFLTLFDGVIARGLKELERLPLLMAPEGGVLQEGVVPSEVPGETWEALVDTERSELSGTDSRRWQEQRKRLLEMWEGMYGEESEPSWLREYDFYEESETESLKRRFGFFRRLPDWGRSRFRAVDLTNVDPENVPGVKAYVGALLGWEMWVEKPVVNVFPMYNLRLVDDDFFYDRWRGVLSHDLTAEDVLKPEYMEPVGMPEREYTDADYVVLRSKLPLLHYNLLFEGLFREGIRAENYRILKVPEQSGVLLVFRHVQRGEWVNLGRFETREELETTAGCLKHFLIMLNRKSESMYVVEDALLGGERRLTVVFPGWSVRMAEPRFRRECEKLVCRRLPAHLPVVFQWRNAREMWKFERAYYDWRKALAAGESGREEAQVLKEVVGE